MDPISIIKEIDNQLEKFENSNLIPTSIMLNSLNFYSLVGYIQKSDNEDFSVNISATTEKSLVSSSFYYKGFPIFYFQRMEEDSTILVLGRLRESLY